MTSTPPVAAGARIRFTVVGTVRTCYQQGEVTLADGTSLSYDPAQHRAAVLAEGWRPGDVIETQHGRLRRTERGGYHHWVHERSGQMFHDDQVDPVRARVVSWWGGRRTPTDPAPAETEPGRMIGDYLARHYDGQPLAELRDEHAAHHLEAAAKLLPLIPETEPDPRPSRFHATPAEVDAYLRTLLAEDVYLRYQQAIGYAALAEATEDAATVRAQADNEGLYTAAWREGWDDAIQRVDPDQNGPTPAGLVDLSHDDEQEREPDVDGAGRTRESYYTPKPTA
ncbi:hypothetical protein RKD35_002857 [Streptomyces albogriseolus]